MMEEDGTRSLAELFQRNQGSIGVSKRVNLFREMDENPLTKEEQDIIQKRVQAQRDMFEEYERREKKRKVQEIRSVFPDLTEEQALDALERCGGNEDETVAELMENPSLLRRILGISASRRRHHRVEKAFEAPKVPRTIDGSVFVGSFRGKLGPMQEKHSNASETKPEDLPRSLSSGVPDTSATPVIQEEEALRSKKTKKTRQVGQSTHARACGMDQPTATGCGGSNRHAENGQERRSCSQTKEKCQDPLSAPNKLSADVVQSHRTGQDKPGRITRSRSASERVSKNVGSAVHELGFTGNQSKAVQEAEVHHPDPLDLISPGFTAETSARHVASSSGRGCGPLAGTLPRISIRCIQCQRAKRGHCGTDRAIRRCLKRGGDAVNPSCQFGTAANNHTPRKKRRTTCTKPSANWLQSSLVGCELSHSSLSRPGQDGSLSHDSREKDGTAPRSPVAMSDRSRQTLVQQEWQIISEDMGQEAQDRRLPVTLGRKRQKACKNCELVQLGKLQTGEGWYNAGYIFPDGLHTRTVFRSSVMVDQLVVHDCKIIGEGGQFWPRPTFRIVAADRPDEPFEGRSCTSCWTAILNRINGEINRRREEGEDLPPPPRTAIAGPEYFGLCNPEVIAMFEALDAEKKCKDYWQGKNARLVFAKTGVPVPREKKVRERRARSTGSLARRSRRTNEHDSDAYFDEEFGVSRWSSLSRAERYKRRNGGQVAGDNPLPGFIDPITLEEVVNPAISPDGHVMGYATWVAVLAENAQCPFTKKPLSREHLVKLTRGNLERYQDRIIYQ